MAAEKPPSFRGLPLVARLYLTALFLVAGVLLLSAQAQSTTELDPLLLAVTATLCAVTNLFEVFAPGHYSFQPNLVFFFLGALLLPPWAVALLSVLSFLPGWLVHRFRG